MPIKRGNNASQLFRFLAPIATFTLLLTSFLQGGLPIQAQESYTVTFDTQGGSTVASASVPYGGLVTQPTDPTRTGYTFGGWYKEAAATNAWNFASDTVTSAITLYAKWTINQYTITFDSNGGSPTPAAITQDFNTAVAAPANPTKTGYTFTGWSPTVPATMPALNITCVAQWTAINYTVTFDTQGGSTVASASVPYGGLVTQPTDPTRTGYTFGGWYKEAAATNAWNFASDTVTSAITLYAKWTINQYTITFDSNGGSPTPAAITQDFNTAVAAPANPTKTGYTFTGWSPTVPATMPALNITCVAQWTAINYTVTFDTQGGSTVASASVPYGGLVTQPTDPTRTGYTFGGWYKEAAATNAWNFASDTVTSAITLYAKWTINQYTITFDSNGGSPTPAAITQDFNTAVAAPANPTKTGYTFTGWSPTVPATMPALNITCVAQWTAINYTVTFDTQGGSTVASASVPYGGLVTQPTDPTRTGYTFGGWYKEAAATNAWNFASDTVTSAITLYAKWTINQYTITFDSNGGSPTPAAITQDFNTAVAAPANPTKTGYTFTGWSPTVPATMPALNITCVAQWTAINYTVTFDTQGGSTVASASVPYGGLVTQPTDPTRTGYTFGGWYKEAAATNAWNFASDTVTSAITLYAKWTINQYTITFDSNGGSPTPAAITQDFNTAVAAPANPTKTGYTFTGWSPTVPATMPALNITCVAQWTAINYTVTFDTQGGSTVASASVPYGGLVTQPTDPTRTGYTFGGWYKEAAATNAWNFASDTVTSAITLYAKWTINQYTITFDSNGGSPTPAAITQDFNTAVAAPANPTKTGYTFTGWSPTVPATMPALNITCVAQWTAINYTVTFDTQGGSTVASASVPYGGLVTQPTDPTRTGYTFGGWYKEAAATNAWNFASDTVTSAITLYAKWTINQYTITFDSNGGSPTPAAITQDFNTAVAAPANPTKTGYTFTGWSPTVPATMPALNITCVAQWTAINYTVTFDTQGGSTVASASVPYGGLVTQPTDPTRTGYTFGGWYKEAAATNAWNFASDTVTSAITLYAKWTINQYTITFDSNGGSPTPAAITQDFNTAVAAPANPTKTGYTFTGWSPTVPATMPALNITCVAQWTAINYTVTFDTQGGSTVASASVPYGGLVTQPTDPTRTGYTFGGWYKEAAATNAWNFASDTVTSAITLYAKWTINQYTITFDSNGGSPTPAAITQDFNTAVAAPANPTKTGYTFTGWSPTVPATMPALNITCVAQWTAINYTVTFDTQGGSTVASASVPYGGLVTQPTDPTRTGYTFGGWYKEAAATNAWNFASDTVTSAITLYAKWTINQYTITFDSNGGSPTPAAITQDFNTAVAAPANPTKTGYTFTGWSPTVPATMPALNITCVAQWTIISGGGGGGGGGFGNQLIGINLAGTSPFMDGNGKSITAGQISTLDGKVTLTVPVGVYIWNAAGAAQSFLSATALSSPPQAPLQNSLIMAWELGPSGVTFTPAITLTFNYSDSEIPAGTSEADLYIGWWDGTTWVKLIGTVNPSANTVSAQIIHFTNFALVAPAALPTPPPTLKIASPSTGTSFDSGNVTMSIDIGNLNLVSGNQPNAPGEGGVVYYLDVPIPSTPGSSALSAVGTYKESESNSNIWTNLAPGNHILGVQLVQNDNTPFNPPVFATVSITVKEAVIVPPTTTVPIPTDQSPLPTVPSSNPTTTNWTIPILFLIAALTLGILLYWRARKPSKLKYTNR